jgi:hypothetical protein
MGIFFVEPCTRFVSTSLIDFEKSGHRAETKWRRVSTLSPLLISSNLFFEVLRLGLGRRQSGNFHNHIFADLIKLGLLR